MTHAERALAYARGVVDGKIIAGELARLACQRQIDDLKRWKKKSSEFHFDPSAANRVCGFIECLPHVKGEWARNAEKIKLEPWQCFDLAVSFGWKREDGSRRFRTTYREVARKNAKSTIAAGVALYAAGLDWEPGSEVYSAATTRDQAKIVWKTARDMIRKSPSLREVGFQAHAHAITAPDGSSFQALSAEAGTLDGLNVHCAVVDELHAHPKRDVWEVIETATGSRRQPLIWAVTTAGSDRAGICYEQRDYLLKVLNGVTKDETYFGIVYTIDEGDDWTDERCWPKANPNLGVSVKIDDLRRKSHKAKEQTSAQPGFLTKHLNLWVNADQAWMDMRRWDLCGDPALDIDDFHGERCWVGADLASKTDIAAVGAIFEREGKRYLFRWCWAPEEAIEGSRNSQYQGWERSGKLIATDGATIDFEKIEDKILELHRNHRIVGAAFDKWQSHRTMTLLAEHGVPVVEYPQIAAYQSEPMKQLEADVLDGKVVHEGCPCAAWQVSNVVARVDNRDNASPRKERDANKIDLPVAWISAFGMYLRAQEEGPVNLDDMVFA